MDAQQMFRAGDLTGALEAQQALVKNRPADAGARTFFFELLAFAGQLERAAKQLTALGAQDIERDIAAQTYATLLKAEAHRRRVFEEGIDPKFFLDVPDDVQQHLIALSQLRGGMTADAATIIAAAEDMRPEITGQMNGAPIEGLRDADDLLAPVMEMYFGPEYYWVPWSQISNLEIADAETPRDLIWQACQLVLSDGSIRRGHLPGLYPGSHESDNDQIRLGQITDWSPVAVEDIVRGLGRKVLLAGEFDITLLDLRLLAISSNLGSKATDSAASET